MTSPTTTPTWTQIISWQADVWPHLRSGIFLTGSFVVAWSWDLLLYSLSHAAVGQNPRQDQIGFGNSGTDKHGGGSSTAAFLLLFHALWLLSYYLVVCAAMAGASQYVTATFATASWRPAAVQALEFFPSPVFAGKLLQFLGHFGRLGAVQRGLVNLLATALCAVLAHFMPTDAWQGTAWARFPAVVQSTLGFGLGIAWNIFLGQLLLPQSGNDDNKKNDDDDDTEFDLVQFVAMGGYLCVVFLLAMRVAALKHEYPSCTMANSNSQSRNKRSTASTTVTTTTTTLWERQCDLAAFAMQVVCAFTLVTFLDAFVVHEAWYGTLQAIVVLLVLSALLSAVVASVDLDALRQRQQLRQEHEPSSSMTSSPALCLLWIPCLWCCCPWVPVLVLLSHIQADSTAQLKEDWYQLVAMVTGLAASIEASNLVTAAVNAIAGGFCTAKHCQMPWAFCVLQFAAAVVTTAVLLPALGALLKKNDGENSSDTARSKGRGEAQALLASA